MEVPHTDLKLEPFVMVEGVKIEKVSSVHTWSTSLEDDSFFSIQNLLHLCLPFIFLLDKFFSITDIILKCSYAMKVQNKKFQTNLMFTQRQCSVGPKYLNTNRQKIYFSGQRSSLDRYICKYRALITACNMVLLNGYSVYVINVNVSLKNILFSRYRLVFTKIFVQ